MNCGFFVPGNPVPKGSVTPGVTKYGKPYQYDQQREKLKIWEQDIKQEARKHFDHPVGKDIAVRLTTVFFLRRPKSVTRKYHTVRPDRDKLLRAVQDALQGVVYIDDSQVIGGEPTKEYADNCGPGVGIQISFLD